MHFSAALLLLLPLCLAQFLHTPSYISFEPASTTKELVDLVQEAASFTVARKRLENPSSHYKLGNVYVDQCQVLDAIAFEVLLEFAGRQQVQYQLVQPMKNSVSYHQTLALPSSSADDVSRVLRTPLLSGVNLEGPSSFTFTRPRDDVTMRLPHLVEAGTFRKGVLSADVRLHFDGVDGMRLLSPVTVDIEDTESGETRISWKQFPELELRGDRISISAETRTKVRRRYPSDLEVTFENVSSSPSDMKVKKSSGTHSITLDPESPFLDVLRSLLESTPALADTAQTPLRQQAHRSQRVVSLDAQAVTLVLLPMELITDGVNAVYSVAVARDPHGNKRIVGMQLQPPAAAVSVDDSLIVNNTLPQVLEAFLANHNSALIDA